jgi:hypothetical protein
MDRSLLRCHYEASTAFIPPPGNPLLIHSLTASSYPSRIFEGHQIPARHLNATFYSFILGQSIIHSLKCIIGPIPDRLITVSR